MKGVPKFYDQITASLYLKGYFIQQGSAQCTDDLK